MGWPRLVAVATFVLEVVVAVSSVHLTDDLKLRGSMFTSVDSDSQTAKHIDDARRHREAALRREEQHQWSRQRGARVKGQALGRRQPSRRVLQQYGQDDSHIPDTVLRGSPCGPSPLELPSVQNGRSTRTGVKSEPFTFHLHDQGAFDFDDGVEIKPFTFYLHEKGAFDFNDTVNCLFDSIGSSLDSDDLDLRLMPNQTEHITDVWLLDALRKHPGRTKDPAAASLHIVGAPLFTSLVAAQASNLCGGMEAHWRRVDNLAKGLASRLFNSHCDGCDFLFINSSPWIQKSFGLQLLEVIKKKPIMLATADRQYDELVGAFAGAPWHIVNIPYKANSITELSSAIGRSSPGGAERNVSVVFHGNMGRRHEGAARPVLRDLVAGLADTSIENVNFRTFQKVSAFRTVSVRTAETYMRSSFCLVPAGDTPTSRRLFDALSAGCVPIVLGAFETIAANLPFPSAVPWADMAIFAGPLDCVEDRMAEEATWLRSLVAGQRSEAVGRMRELGQEVFRSALSYTRGGVAPLLLHEAAAVLAAHATAQ